MITKYFKNLVAGGVFHATDAPASIPDTYWFGISSTVPDEDGGNVTEPSASDGYARTPISALKMKVGEDGVVTNGAAISTTEALAVWGSFPCFTIFDAETGGHLLAYGNFNGPKTIAANSILTVKAESMTLTVQNV